MATDRSLQKSFLTDYEPAAARKKPSFLDKAAEYNSQLHERVDSLQDFITQILKRQEREFLKAAKSQISQLNYEIHTLKKDAMQRDDEEELLRLRSSLEWVRDEAVKLESTCKRLKSDLARWKAKAASLEDDRNFLEKQLKEALKDKRPPLEKPQKREDPTLPPIRKPVLDMPKITLPNTKAGQFIAQLLITYAPDDPELFVVLEKHMSEQEVQWQVAAEHYKKTIFVEKKRLNTLNTTFSSAIATRSELEEVFFECVKSVRSEVQRRKEVQGHVRSKSTNSHIESHAAAKFSAADKKRVLELLVENETVLTRVYEAIFPHRAKKLREDFTPLTDIPEEKMKDLAQLSAELR